jgi:hypothetical protein
LTGFRKRRNASVRQRPENQLRTFFRCVTRGALLALALKVLLDANPVGILDQVLLLDQSRDHLLAHLHDRVLGRLGDRLARSPR